MPLRYREELLQGCEAMELKISQGRRADFEIDDDIADTSNAIARTSGTAPTSVVGSPGAIPTGATLLVPIDGVIKLPAGTRLDAIRVSGANLVITLPDG
jgi:hypothetical protein